MAGETGAILGRCFWEARKLASSRVQLGVPIPAEYNSALPQVLRLLKGLLALLKIIDIGARKLDALGELRMLAPVSL